MTVIMGSKNKKKYLIGITGSFGTGKSFVGEVLNRCGIAVIDTDRIVKNILSNKNQITKKIVTVFGKDILTPESKSCINKKKLAEIVFNNNSKRILLEKIIHPEVKRRLHKLINKKKNKIIVVLIPLLFESKLEEDYDEIWCVVCNLKVQLKRLKERGFSLKDSIRRIKAQLPQNQKAKLADFVIDNSSSRANTKKQIINKLKSLAQLNRSSHLSSDK